MYRLNNLDLAKPNFTNWTSGIKTFQWIDYKLRILLLMQAQQTIYKKNTELTHLMLLEQAVHHL